MMASTSSSSASAPSTMTNGVAGAAPGPESALVGRIEALTASLERAEAELAFRATELDLLRTTWAHALAASARGRGEAAAAKLEAREEIGAEELRSLLDDHAFLLGQVHRLEQALEAAQAPKDTRRSPQPHRHDDDTAEAAAAAAGPLQLRALQAKLAAAEAHIEQLRREHAPLGPSADPERRLPGSVTLVSPARRLNPPALGPSPVSPPPPPPGAADGGRWGREAALEAALAEQADQLARQDRDLRAASAEMARLREYSTFHIGYWRSTAQAHETALARVRAEKALAERRLSASSSPALSTEPSSPSEAAGAAAAALRRARSPLPALSPYVSPGFVRRAQPTGLYPAPVETATKATQTDAADGADGDAAAEAGRRTLAELAGGPEDPAVAELRRQLDEETARNARLADKLREQVELVQQTKRLLLAVGVGSGRRDATAEPEADAIALGTDEWEALLRERVRRDLAAERDLQAARERAAQVSQVEEERDAWRTSTRQLEAALMAMSARCADLEYVLASVPDSAKPALAARANGVRRFTSQPPPDLSVHGCPRCRDSIVLVI